VGRAVRIAAAGALLLAFAPALRADSIVNSKHNLSSAGPNPIRALNESEICIFCHTPHASSDVGVLWNRVDSDAVYDPYRSSTTFAAIGQPTGASRLCLSCHDGTVALGALYNVGQEVEFEGGIRFLDPAHGSLETALTDDHPVSFVYDAALAAANGELADPGTLPDEKMIDRAGQMQCTACHEPHDDRYGHFLRFDTAYGELCTLCHEKNGWGACSHALSTAEVPGGIGGLEPGAPPEPVAERACLACHTPHASPAPERLRRARREEENCFPCHDGTVATYDIESQFSKAYVHPVADTSGIHDPVEVPADRGRHVECEDCHNPHAANPRPTGSNGITGPLDFVDGIDLGGAVVYPAQWQYEICMKCHGPNPIPVDRVPRLVVEEDILAEIDPSNPAYHPIAAPGRNPDVPSLIPPWDENSTILCTDCHNNDEVAGGGGPSGPHGSIHDPILERRYSRQDYQQESYDAYAMCYKCHDYDSIMNGDSFKEHKKHIQKEDAPCSACHDPHGVSATAGGTPSNNSHLINFDVSIVQPNRDNLLYFEDLGTFAGRCYLKCHREDHHPEEYHQHGHGGGD
jgi:predicted CXXCH cytochrome family protein